MTEYDYWKIFPRMPKSVTVGDITARDGLQHEEKFISTAAKIYYIHQKLVFGIQGKSLTRCNLDPIKDRSCSL